MATIPRRTFIAASLGGMTAAVAGLGASEPEPPAGLAAAAARRRLFFGAAVRPDQLEAEGDLRQAVLAECSCITPELALKWGAVEPSRGRLVLQPMDALRDFAAKSGKRMRGHTLMWHRSVPDWAQAALQERADWGLISSYFDAVITRYGGAIKQWDVVNEPIDPGHRSDGLRENAFLKAFGPDYIARALVEARRLAPQGELLINEYGLEYDLSEERQRRNALLKLIERLKASGTPLDGVGLQAHLDLRKGRVATSTIKAFMRELAGFGLSIMITELDVKEAQYADSAAARDRMVSDEVRRYLDVALEQPAVAGLATWGLSDRHSWLEVTKADYARFPHAWKDGGGPGLNRGLPFDASMQRKPMYFAIQAALLGREKA